MSILTGGGNDCFVAEGEDGADNPLDPKLLHKRERDSEGFLREVLSSWRVTSDYESE
jgi:hypothetical protein